MMRILGIGGAASLAGCTQTDDPEGTESPSGTDDGGTETDDGGESNELTDGYVTADGTDAETMNWVQVADDNTDSRISLTMDAAYTIQPGREIFPLWMDIEDSGDSQVFVATLRDNLQWSDPYGQMTAEDWVYLIEEIHQGEENWAGSQAASDWAGINVEQSGELEFQVELENATPDFPFEPVLWGAYCMPKDLIQPYVEERDHDGFQQDEEIQTLSYTGNLGPYEFDHWEREAEFVATRNDDYYMQGADDVPAAWQDAPYFDQYTIQAISEESTRLSALRTGEVTSTAIPADKVEQFEAESAIDVKEIPQPFLTILAYNQRANGWDQLRNREVRQALSTAVDKSVIGNEILRGYAEVAHTFQPQWSPWYDEGEVTKFGVDDSYSHEAARDMLDSATDSDYGYDGDQLLGPDGEQVTLTLVYSEGTETTATTAEYMTQEFAGVGIDVELESVTFDRMLQQYVMNEWQGDEDDREWTGGPFNDGPRENSASAEQWDMMYGINFNTYPWTPAATDAFWTEKSSTNYYGYVPEADMQSKFETIRTSSDQSEREQALAEIFGILSEDQPVSFVAMSDDIIGYQDYVRGPIEEFGSGWDYPTWDFAQQ